MNHKILLVDDDPRVLHALRRTLGHRFNLFFATGGREALAMVDNQGPFAAIVSDLNMPGMGGIELMREMREKAPETVRLILSGHGDFAAALAALNDGAVFRFHTKPVSPEMLEASIVGAIVRHEAEKRLHGQIDPGEHLIQEAELLRRAIAENQLRLFLQPQFRLTDGAMAGAEALVRWAHPAGGLLLPGEFMGTAEAAGLLGDITSWMLEAACAQARLWCERGLPALRIAVNITASDLAQASPGLPVRVRSALERHALAPAWLELELTEQAALGDAGRAHDALKEVAALGVSLAIDDFGSGYSSLGWLRHLPVHKLKIDRLFLQDVATDSEALRLLETIITLAGDLKLVVTAEGIESPAQLDLLRRTQCDLVQGFLLARPMPAADFVPGAPITFWQGLPA